MSDLVPILKVPGVNVREASGPHALSGYTISSSMMVTIVNFLTGLGENLP